jgi:transcriptional regulator with XRE-family HTH domain
MSVRLKLLRKQKGWSLETLADHTGLTKSYLSKVERGLSVPSIAVAMKLSAALQVDVEELFSAGPSRATVTITRSGERTPMGSAFAAGARATESIAAGVAPKRMLPFVVHPPADYAASEFKEHAGEEFLFVHRGTIEIAFPDRTVQLETGDSVYFNALVPHRLRRLGSEPAEVLVVVAQEESAG